MDIDDKMKLKFYNNLKEMSSDKDDFFNEWEYKRLEKDSNGKCICLRKLKHIHYFHNSLTDKYIQCGEKCSNQLQTLIVINSNKLSKGVKKKKNYTKLDKIVDLSMYSNETFKRYRKLVIFDLVIKHIRIVRDEKEITMKWFEEKERIRQEQLYKYSKYKIKFGKYQDKTLKYIIENDKQYLEWCIKQEWFKGYFRNVIEEYLQIYY